jgi:hypothetical protein
MELIRGVPLNEYCDQHKLSIAGRLALFIQICSGVQHAHQKGVSRQLIGEVVRPIPARPGQPERFDYEYVRNGTANLFMVFEPLLGWRAVQVTERRTARDFAEVLRWLVEEVHADRRLGGGPQRAGGRGQVALHDGRCPHQAPYTLPIT